MFGGDAAAKSFMGIDDGQRATWTQDALSSSAGAVASITVAQPLDVIKVSPQSYIDYYDDFAVFFENKSIFVEILQSYVFYVPPICPNVIFT